MELDRTNIPTHIAIIMDGNGRWAKQKGLPRTAGHAEGTATARRIMEEATRLGVKFLTLYTFSTENWSRPPEEVAAIFRLLLDNLEEEVFIKNKVRLRVIGDTWHLPDDVRQRVQQTEHDTRHFTGTTIVIALNYSARWEITEAMREIGELIERRETLHDYIDEQMISQHLTTSFMPDPDLLIRTGGEQRISNYLLWQCAYTEFYFTDTFWPDFHEEQFHQAIAEYQHRQRRFGKTGEQVEAELAADTTHTHE